VADYSRDVELDHNGDIVPVRPLEPMGVVDVPYHMFLKACRTPSLRLQTLRTKMTDDEWRRFTGGKI